MKRAIRRAEILLPFSDYNKLETSKEGIVKLIICIVISLSIEFVLFYYKGILEASTLINYINDFISLEIDIIALLLSFSIAYLTMLISAEGQNIRRIKTYETKIEIDGKKITLYQILLIQLTYTIYCEIVLLLLLLIHKLLILLFSIEINMLFLIADIIILINILYIIIKNVKNIYLSFWKNEINE